MSEKKTAIGGLQDLVQNLDPTRRLREMIQKADPLHHFKRRDADDGDNEAAERLREARAEAEDDLREVILNIIRKGDTITVTDVGELSEVASAYFDDDVFEREFCGGDDGT